MNDTAAKQDKARRAQIKRTTGETDIEIDINLDGNGVYEISTGIGFFDHMLEQLSRHSLIDIKIQAKGDLHIDEHHTIEDTGLALGEALTKALGDKAGIRRYGQCLLAMDEALSRAVLDLSGRPYLIWKVNFDREKLGDMPTELFHEFFHAFSQKGGITLHVETLYGYNNHHKIESCFKAVARALRQAVEHDPRAPGAIPSTKGLL